ncbi:hypothetical protein KO497_13735 [Pacificibacter marinus]|nr:hypothetical protein [Pacificibacter marinus]
MTRQMHLPPSLKVEIFSNGELVQTDDCCRYAVDRETFPLTSQTWEEGDVHDLGAQGTHDVLLLTVDSDMGNVRAYWAS